MGLDYFSGLSSCYYGKYDIYWIPIYEILEDVFAGGITLLVENVRYMKNVPGKKTDIFGTSGRNIILYLTQHGQIDRDALDSCLKTKTRNRIDEIFMSVNGALSEH